MSILGFDYNLLQRFKVILAVISCYEEINTEAFRAYALETAKIYARIYDWYYMPTSMHVILIHGYKIMQNLFLPIGMLSEEAQESNHKLIKKFRENFSRKESR